MSAYRQPGRPILSEQQLRAMRHARRRTAADYITSRVYLEHSQDLLALFRVIGRWAGEQAVKFFGDEKTVVSVRRDCERLEYTVDFSRGGRTRSARVDERLHRARDWLGFVRVLSEATGQALRGFQ